MLDSGIDLIEGPVMCPFCTIYCPHRVRIFYEYESSIVNSAPYLPLSFSAIEQGGIVIWNGFDLEGGPNHGSQRMTMTHCLRKSQFIKPYGFPNLL